MQDSFSQPDVDHGVIDLVVDQLEEFVVTIVEEIRQRPGVAAAILAAVVGAFIGALLANRARPEPPPPVGHRVRTASDVAALAAVAFRLFQHPMIRGIVTAIVENQIKRRMAR